jgi:hypothetical protein
MDPSRFDDLTRVLSRASGRRPLLGALFGALLGSSAAEATRKRRKARGNDDDRDPDKGRAEDREREQRLQSERRGKGGKRRKHKKKRGGGDGSGQTPPPPQTCCGTKSCRDPEPGSTRAGCDFAGRSFAGEDHNGSTFRGIDGRNASFTATDNHGSVFAEACLQEARFRRAKLDGSTWGGACLFGADFTGADLGDDLTLFDNALFCNTTMPDGSVNDRDCDRKTTCCRAELGGEPECQSASDCDDEACRTKDCQNGQCVYAVVADGSSLNGECGTDTSGHCCEGACCLPGATECNPLGLCCAPNCPGRECGEDGCGNPDGCGTCPSGQGCNAAGQCVCDEQSCPEGCCDAGGDCRSGNTLQRCGTGGAACESCNSAEICRNGQCVTCAPNCTCTGQDACASPGEPPPNTICGQNAAGATCRCLVSGAGQPFCGTPTNLTGCTSDTQCQDFFGPGFFCVDAAPAGSTCPTSGNFCAAPCCNAQTCPDGCCDANGACQPGNVFSDCGEGGGQCATCNQNQSCLNQQCAPCSVSCVDLDHACGPDGCGGSCGACVEGLGCVDGICVCTAQSCPNGCCPGGTGDTIPCIPLSQQNQAACGLGGSCQACAPGDACVAGVCVCQPDCFGNTCGPDSCGNPNGCGSCGPCQTCDNGACVPLPNRTFACDGSELAAPGPAAILCTTQRTTGVCVDGACDCSSDGAYDAANNVCNCEPANAQSCAANRPPQCCQILFVCVDTDGNTAGDFECSTCG